MSTDEVYGSLGHESLPFKETSCYAPNSPYSASKELVITLSGLGIKPTVYQWS